MAVKEEVQGKVFQQLLRGLAGAVVMTAAATALSATMVNDARADGFGSATMQTAQAAQPSGETPEFIKNVGGAIGGGIKKAGGALSDAAKAVSDSQKGGWEDPSKKKPSFWEKLSAVKLPEPEPKIIQAEKIGPRF